MGQKGSEKNDSENERERETKTNEEEDFDDIIFDVAILGAGMSGLSCAREICFALRDDDEKNALKVALWFYFWLDKLHKFLQKCTKSINLV